MYLDDVICAGQETVANIRRVFQRLRLAGLELKLTDVRAYLGLTVVLSQIYSCCAEVDKNWHNTPALSECKRGHWKLLPEAPPYFRMTLFVGVRQLSR